MKRRIAAPRPRAIVPAAFTALILLTLAHAAPADAPRPATAGATVAARPAVARAHAKQKLRATRARSKSAHAPVGASGMKAAIDPATGRLVRPTAEQVQALDAQAGMRRVADDDPSRGIPVIQLANGAEMARLDERFQEFEVARIGADGKLVRSCVQGEDAAAKFRKDATAKAAAKASAPAPAKEVR